MSQIKIAVDRAHDAIIHVDVQPAFMEAHVFTRPFAAGGLPVPGALDILTVVFGNNALFAPERRYATLDKHPEGHISWVTSYAGLPRYHDLTLVEVNAWPDGSRIVSMAFSLDDLKAYLAGVPGQKQTLWPRHAAAGSRESMLHPVLETLYLAGVFMKGLDPRCDSYSGVRDNLGRPTGLALHLRLDDVKRVFVDGLAYTHCVGWTALDLVAEGFKVFVIKDATRSVPIPGLEDEMTRQLLAAGVVIIDSRQLALP